MIRATWLIAGLIGLLAITIAQPFTYQGFLREGNAPANGNYDFRFRLYSDPDGSNQVGSAVFRTGVAVQNGLFTVQLDFGNVWTGEPRYLEISVRRVGGSGYTVLSPLVAITNTPYASFARQAQAAQQVPWSGITGMPAGFADGVDNDTTYSAGAGLALTGTVFSVATGGVVSIMLADSAVTTAKLADNAVTTAKIGDSQVTDPKIVSVSWSKITGAPNFLTSVAAQTPLLGTGTAADPLRLRPGTTAGQVLRWSGSQWEPGEVSLSGAAGGDLSGNYPNPLVVGLRGRPIASTAPTTGQVLKWDGSAWTPAPDEGRSYSAGAGLTLTGDTFSIATGGVVSNMLANNAVTTAKIGDGQVTDPKIVSVSWSKLTGIPAAGGDVSGTYPNLTVTRLQGRSVSAQVPTAGQVLKWTGNEWAPQNDEAGGTSQWQQSGSNIFYAAGNVGIGTSNPTYRLHVEVDIGSGVAVFGHHTLTTGGYTYGVYGRSDGPDGTGVSGWASATTGRTYGVRGVSDSTSGTGVYGWATANSGPARGVWGKTYSTDSYAYGVYGEEFSGGAGHAIYAFGSFAATGTKSFQIDHPLHPETHYLNHFCVEGPEPYNIYRGTVTLDAHGEAWVQLPDYFELINRDPVITLTPIGAPMPNLHVVVEVEGNRFKIAGGAPGRKVSWRVEAIRNDLWVQRYGYQTEQEKEDAIKGKYLHPELYNQPMERGIHWRAPAKEPK